VNYVLFKNNAKGKSSNLCADFFPCDIASLQLSGRSGGYASTLPQACAKQSLLEVEIKMVETLLV
jgi:hypothetical protein